MISGNLTQEIYVRKKRTTKKHFNPLDLHPQIYKVTGYNTLKPHMILCRDKDDNIFKYDVESRYIKQDKHLNNFYVNIREYSRLNFLNTESVDCDDKSYKGTVLLFAVFFCLV